MVPVSVFGLDTIVLVATGAGGWDDDATALAHEVTGFVPLTLLTAGGKPSFIPDNLSGR